MQNSSRPSLCPAQALHGCRVQQVLATSERTAASIERLQTRFGLVKFSARHPEPDIELRASGSTLLKRDTQWTQSEHFHSHSACCAVVACAVVQADWDGLFAMKPADMAELAWDIGSRASAEVSTELCEFPRKSAPKWEHPSLPGPLLRNVLRIRGFRPLQAEVAVCCSELLPSAMLCCLGQLCSSA